MYCRTKSKRYMPDTLARSTASMTPKSPHHLYLCVIIVGWFGPLPVASAIGKPARAFAFAHCPRIENEAGIGRRRAIATAGAAFVSGQVPIAVIAADSSTPVKDNADPLAAFGASLSGSNDIIKPTGQQPVTETAAATGPPPSSAASGPPTAAGGPPSSLDATLDQLSKKRTIEPRTHG